MIRVNKLVLFMSCFFLTNSRSYSIINEVILKISFHVSATFILDSISTQHTHKTPQNM
jgi:hypothetical protein